MKLIQEIKMLILKKFISIHSMASPELQLWICGQLEPWHKPKLGVKFKMPIGFEWRDKYYSWYFQCCLLLCHVDECGEANMWPGMDKGETGNITKENSEIFSALGKWQLLPFLSSVSISVIKPNVLNAWFNFRAFIFLLGRQNLSSNIP